MLLSTCDGVKYVKPERRMTFMWYVLHKSNTTQWTAYAATEKLGKNMLPIMLTSHADQIIPAGRFRTEIRAEGGPQ